MNYQSPLPSEPATAPADTVDAPRRARSRRLLIGIALAVGALVAAIIVWQAFLRPAPPAPEPEPGPRVTVAIPGRATIAGEINTTGTIAARRTLPVGVVGEGGRVVSVAVDQGDWVRQGQVLATIDRSVQAQQARSAAAQIRVAQADARLAQSNLDRALQLVERGFVSQADVDRLTATRDAAQARVNVAQAQLGELSARNARLDIYAPASGLVLERNVEPGQTVGGGSAALFTIAQNGEMEMLARVGEAELARLATGTQARVTPTGSDRSFSGAVWQVEPTIDEQTRQGTARIALSYAAALRPGGFATAVIDSGTVVAPMLPESAIQSDDDGSYVYIVGADDTVQRRAVQIGLVTANGIAVTSGLDGTERVVLRAGGFLNPGDVVQPTVERR